MGVVRCPTQQHCLSAHACLWWRMCFIWQNNAGRFNITRAFDCVLHASFGHVGGMSVRKTKSNAHRMNFQIVCRRTNNERCSFNCWRYTNAGKHSFSDLIRFEIGVCSLRSTLRTCVRFICEVCMSSVMFGIVLFFLTSAIKFVMNTLQQVQRKSNIFLL